VCVCVEITLMAARFNLRQKVLLCGQQQSMTTTGSMHEILAKEELKSYGKL
jgi:hypothetical protein